MDFRKNIIFDVEFLKLLPSPVDLLENIKIAVIIDNCYLYLGGAVLSNFSSPSFGGEEGYSVKEDDAMNEDIFLQVIIILVIIIYGNQKKGADK